MNLAGFRFALQTIGNFSLQTIGNLTVAIWLLYGRRFIILICFLHK